MIRVSVLYPAKAGSRFDEKYYFDVHMPMAIGLIGSALRSVSVEKGISGATPDQPAPFVMACHLVFESTEAFYAAFVPHAAAIQGDIPTYTDIQPIIQIGEIRFSRQADLYHLNMDDKAPLRGIVALDRHGRFPNSPYGREPDPRNRSCTAFPT